MQWGRSKFASRAEAEPRDDRLSNKYRVSRAEAEPRDDRLSNKYRAEPRDDRLSNKYRVSRAEAEPRDDRLSNKYRVNIMTFCIDHADCIVFCVLILDIEEHVHIGFVTSAVPGLPAIGLRRCDWPHSSPRTGNGCLRAGDVDVGCFGGWRVCPAVAEGVSGGGLTWTVCSLMQGKKRKCPGKYIPGQI
ncbi:hypothetical protein Bbelb_163060 [Branchiostoma belcheri]|nr:hypothetical protein Bbelb_163060 [Branchiostoma belcheri]